jgi:hypothetical protein
VNKEPECDKMQKDLSPVKFDMKLRSVIFPLPLTVWLAAVLVFIALPAQPLAQLNYLKFKLQTKVQKKSVSKTRC